MKIVEVIVEIESSIIDVNSALRIGDGAEFPLRYFTSLKKNE